jgi:CubicO group peptidase (beta-lactamase class C family)
MKLYEQGRLALDDKLIQYVPNANSHGKDKITIRNLLLHNAGLIPDMPGKNFTGFSEDDLK